MSDGSNRFKAALKKLMDHESRMRLSGNDYDTAVAVKQILQLCFDFDAWNTLNQLVLHLPNAPSQFEWMGKLVVEQAMEFVDDIPDVDTRIKLIDTLRNVSQGMPYVENEKARLIQKLAQIKEQQGLIAEAADLMHGIDLEIYSHMHNTEKIAIILEQVRLSLDCQDFVRAQNILKINHHRIANDFASNISYEYKSDEYMIEVTADVPQLSKLKRIYCELLIRYHSHHCDYLEICRSYKAIYDGIPSVKEDPAEWIPVLRKIFWYLVLSPHDPMQSSLLNSTFEDPNLYEIPKIRLLLKQLVKNEIVQWTSVWNIFKDEFENEKNFVVSNPLDDKAVEDLKLRITEHNVRVISKCYSRITLSRLEELLCLTRLEAEKHLSDMIVSKSLAAKIDRPAGIVCFYETKDLNDILNSWSMNLEKILDLVDTMSRQINNETITGSVGQRMI